MVAPMTANEIVGPRSLHSELAAMDMIGSECSAIIAENRAFTSHVCHDVRVKDLAQLMDNKLYSKETLVPASTFI